jgi:hypothetical protein
MVTSTVGSGELRNAAIRRRRAARPGNQGSLVGDWVAFLIPVLDAFSIQFGGQLPYAEVIFILALPVLAVTRGYRIFDRNYRVPFLLLALWAFSQTLTDLYVETSPANRVKGFARVLFFALDLACVNGIIGTSLRRTKIFAVGMIFNFLYIAHSGGGGPILEWKMGRGIAVSMAVLLFASWLFVKRKFVPVLVLTIALAATNLHYAVRSAIMIDLAVVAVLLSMVLTYARGGPTVTKTNAKRPLVILVFLLAAVWGSQQTLQFATKEGYFSEDDQLKYEQQSQGKLGIMLGGRPEGLVAARAILDSPILGHGSYAVDYKYYQLLQQYQYEFGYSASDQGGDIEDPGIPTHSHITMAWVEAGFLASLFWFYMLYLLGRSIVRLTEFPHPLGPLYVYLLMTFTWDILFSPFGFTRRMFEAYLIVIMINLFRTQPVPRPRLVQRAGGRPTVRRPRTTLRPLRSFGQT